jgi:hypothetical protein
VFSLKGDINVVTESSIDYGHCTVSNQKSIDLNHSILFDLFHRLINDTTNERRNAKHRKKVDMIFMTKYE